MILPGVIGGQIESGGGGPVGSPFITAQSLGGPRHDVDGTIGLQFVSRSTKSIKRLGAWSYAGNTGLTTIYFGSVDGSGNFTVITSVTVDLSGGIGDYVYGSISPVALVNGVTYAIMRSVTIGGDLWGDTGGGDVTTDSAIGDSVQGAYFTGSLPPTAVGLNGAAQSYGPVNFDAL